MHLQLPQIKLIHFSLQVLKIFPSYPRFRFQFKWQNRKLGLLEYLGRPRRKRFFLKFTRLEKIYEFFKFLIIV